MINPFRDTINRLGMYEDFFEELFCIRVFGIIHEVCGKITAIPVRVTGISNGKLRVEWDITTKHSEIMTGVDITELYPSHEAALKAVEQKEME